MVELITKCLCFPTPLSGFLGSYGPSSPCQRKNVTAIVKLKTIPKVRLLCECCLNLARAGLLSKLLVNLDTPYTYTNILSIGVHLDPLISLYFQLIYKISLLIL